MGSADLNGDRVSPIIIEQDGTRSIKSIPPGMESFSSDLGLYKTIAINDFGDHVVESVPYVVDYDYKGELAISPVLNKFAHENANGSYRNLQPDNETGIFSTRVYTEDDLVCYYSVAAVGEQKYMSTHGITSYHAVNWSEFANIHYNNHRQIAGTGEIFTGNPAYGNRSYYLRDFNYVGSWRMPTSKE